MHDISKVRAKLSSLCIICSLGQVKFSLDTYIKVIYCKFVNFREGFIFAKLHICEVSGK